MFPKQMSLGDLAVRAAIATIFGSLGALSVAVSGCAQSFDYGKPPNTTAFDAFTDSLRLAHSLPALAIIVVRHDTTLAHAAVGRRQLDREDRVTLDDSWQIGSLTKAFTASLIGLLVDRGKLQWTTTIAEALPDLRAIMHPQFQGVTVGQLLSHSAGVPPYTDGADLNKLPKFSGTARERRRAFVAFLLKDAPLFAPGTKHQYSNAGFTIAGAIAEQVANKPWEAQIEEDLLRPLGVRVIFGWPAYADSAQPWGHTAGMRMLHPHDPRDTYQIGDLLAPAGAVSVSMDDYGTFMRAHLAGLRGEDGLLKATTVRTLHTAMPPPPASDTLAGTALGWGVRVSKWGRIHGHAGSAGTFYCVVQLVSEQDLGLAVCTNAGGDRATAGTRAALETLRARYASER
jgi:D-alanyl-D-alanine carboxypeptidase